MGNNFGVIGLVSKNQSAKHVFGEMNEVCEALRRSTSGRPHLDGDPAYVLFPYSEETVRFAKRVHSKSSR